MIARSYCDETLPKPIGQTVDIGLVVLFPPELGFDKTDHHVFPHKIVFFHLVGGRCFSFGRWSVVGGLWSVMRMVGGRWFLWSVRSVVGQRFSRWSVFYVFDGRWSVVFRQWSVVGVLSSIWSVVGGTRSVVGGQWSVVGGWSVGGGFVLRL